MLANSYKTLWKGPLRRLVLAKWIMCLGLLVQLVLCPKLFSLGSSQRTFPTVPVLDFLPDIPYWASQVLSVNFIASVIAVAIFPNPRRWCGIVPALGMLLVAFDINRLQPWFYQLMLLFIVMSFVDWENPESKFSQNAPLVGGFILAATYFWSGLHKFNLAFTIEVFPWLLEPYGFKQLIPLANVVPYCEAGVGLLILFPRTRILALGGAVCMHLFLLGSIGPFGHSYNSVVWPWNIWMPLLAIALLGRNPAKVFPLKENFFANLGWTNGMVVALVGLMPLLNFFGIWDQSLSATLYSGREQRGRIIFSKQGISSIPKDIQARLEYLEPDSELKLFATLYLEDWAQDDMNVPPYPEDRVYRRIAQKLAAMGIPESEMTLLVSGEKGLFTDPFDARPIPIR